MTPSLENLLALTEGERRINYSLDRFKAALASLGNPEKTVKSLIITGTNGKGTTSLFLTAGLRELGFKTATYLSPHLVSPCERFLNNLVPIPVRTLEELLVGLQPAVKKFQLSYFEYLTLAFFVWSAQIGVDFMVLECGLGGRLDATNVTNPLASIITNVALDHQTYLGDNLSAILKEKFGVVRPGSPLFTGLRDQALILETATACRKLGTTVRYSKDLSTKPISASLDGQVCEIGGARFQFTNPSVGTIENASLAFMVLRHLFPDFSPERIAKTFSQVITPGRMEVIQQNPSVIFSGDHNLAGIECLISTLKKMGIKKPHILCGFSTDKPYQEMHARLKTIARDIVVTSFEKQGEIVEEAYRQMENFEPDPLIALQTLIKKSQPDDVILVTGSLYLVGELKRKLVSPVKFVLGEPLSTRRTRA